MEVKDIKKPAFMQEAATGRGHIMILEVMIAILVFLVGSVAMGFIQVPVMFFYLLSDKEYMSMVMTGDTDVQKIMDIAQNIPEWIMIVMLLSEVLLIVIIMLYCRFLERRKLHTMGFRKKGFAVQYLMGLLFGAVAFSGAFLLCVVTGSIKWIGISDNVSAIYIVGYFLGYMVQGMAEEVLCRGYLFVSLTKRYHVTTSIVISALFFAALHGMNNGISVLAMINLFMFGVFAALLLLDCENIWIVGAFHSIWNFVQGNLYGIHVSGNRVQNSVFQCENVEGFEFINGGGFGMEGGISVFIILAIGIVILGYRLKKKGAIINANEQPAPSFRQINANGYNAGNMPMGQNGRYGTDNGTQTTRQNYGMGNEYTAPGQNYGAGNENTVSGQNYGAGNAAPEQDYGTGNTVSGQNYGTGSTASGQGYGTQNANAGGNYASGNGAFNREAGMGQERWQQQGNVSYQKDKPWQHTNMEQGQSAKEENIKQTSFDKDYFKD